MALLSVSSVFAQRANGPDSEGKTASEKSGFKKENFNSFPPAFCRCQGSTSNENEKVLTGVVKGINEKAGTVTVINADGKDETVCVNPFTRINFLPSVPPAFEKNDAGDLKDSKDSKEKRMKGPSFLKLSDIAKGDWVLISTYKTETKLPVASKVTVKKDKTPSKPVDNSNAK